MLNMQGDLGEALFRTWSEEQKLEEIGKLVAGYRAGLPVGILCNMVVRIAGSEAAARTALMALMSDVERQEALEKTDGGLRLFVEPLIGG